MNNGIQVIYPKSKYKKLNDEVFLLIQREILQFMVIARNKQEDKFTYTLDISHDEYSYQDYLSFVFYVSSSTGGNHPSHSIYSICYDISSDSIITMEDLVKKDSDLLSKLSRESRKNLSNNPKIVDYSMMMEGTKEEVSNFSVFAFTPYGIMIFFPQYQVAPYSSGAFKTVFCYDKL